MLWRRYPGSRSRGKRPAMMILAFGFAVWNTDTMDVMPSVMSDGVSRSMLFVPQWMTQICKFNGISPFSTLHRTCWVRSPPMPKFNALNGPKYLAQTSEYRDSPLMIESPINRIPAPPVCAMCTNLSCSAYQPGLVLRPTGVDAGDDVYPERSFLMLRCGVTIPAPSTVIGFRSFSSSRLETPRGWFYSQYAKFLYKKTFANIFIGINRKIRQNICLTEFCNWPLKFKLRVVKADKSKSKNISLPSNPSKIVHDAWIIRLAKVRTSAAKLQRFNVNRSPFVMYKIATQGHFLNLDSFHEFNLILVGLHQVDLTSPDFLKFRM